jgi:hypothetical protein
VINLYSSDTCDPSGNGEGQSYFHSFQQNSNASGDLTFTQVAPIVFSPGAFITATAADSAGNRSEFSQCQQLIIDPDSDDDAFVDVTEAACGANPRNAGSIPERIDGVFAGVNDDADAFIDEPLPPGAANFDCDRDGYMGQSENGTPLCQNGVNDDNLDDGVIDDGCPGGPIQSNAFSESQFKIGTSDQDPCGFNGWPSNVFDPPSPPSALNRLNIQDVIAFFAPARHLDTNPGNLNFSARFDILPGKGTFGTWINIQDMTALFNGPTANPPMFNGARAFDKACPWP